MRRRWVKWLVLGVSLTFTFKMAANVYRLIKSGDRVGQAERELAQAEEENKKLTERLEYVKSEEFVEREARERLGLGKPGEVVVVLQEQNTSLKPQASNPNKPNWRKWWELYVGI